MHLSYCFLARFPFFLSRIAIDQAALHVSSWTLNLNEVRFDIDSRLVGELVYRDLMARWRPPLVDKTEAERFINGM
jgi:hypothetical protein